MLNSGAFLKAVAIVFGKNREREASAAELWSNRKKAGPWVPLSHLEK